MYYKQLEKTAPEKSGAVFIWPEKAVLNGSVGLTQDDYYGIIVLMTLEVYLMIIVSDCYRVTIRTLSGNSPVL